MTLSLLVNTLLLCTLLTFLPNVQAQQCDLIVPANPLTASGLAQPYYLKPPCDQSNPDQSVFVEAVIFNNRTGKLSVYAPLVVNEGSTPLLPIKNITLSPGDIVGIWFGANDNLRIVGNGHGSLSQGNCVTGLGSNDVFGQVAACNAVAWFAAAHKAIRSGLLRVPPLKLGLNGRPCYTVRGFQVVDQDQSDNVDVTYLAVGTRTAQNSAKNKAALISKFGAANVVSLANPSDNGLLNKFLFPALNCTPFSAPDLIDVGTLKPAQALNELQASLYQRYPVALIPAGDPMVLTNGQVNLNKVNAYRAIVDQPLALTLSDASTRVYCRHMLNVGLVSILSDMPFTQVFPSPTPDANNLFDFLIMRFINAFGPDNLNCTGILNSPCPVLRTRVVTADAQVIHVVTLTNDSFMDSGEQDLTVAGTDDDANASAANTLVQHTLLLLVLALLPLLYHL